jgi:hypothetical protein
MVAILMLVGTKKARMTIGKKGLTESYGIPGTGISYRKQHAWKKTAVTPARKETAADNDEKITYHDRAKPTNYDTRNCTKHYRNCNHHVS